ncbi:hypothetical protein T06_11419 [Trichinella sp. T6]|nr:hypothetical protein T06_11419 [Trichinella sp. T6]
MEKQVLLPHNIITSSPKALPKATKIKCVCAHSQLFELVPMITVQRKKPPATGHQDITFRPKGKNLTDDAF